MLAPETLLDDRFRVVRAIGAGGMSMVYEAENVMLGRRVAVKVLNASVVKNPELVARFEREARAAAAVGHENIVEVLDFGRHGRQPFMVMEYLHGESLGRRMNRQRRMPPRDAVDIMVQVLGALAAVHAKGIVHRDLKPENIHLITRGGRTDFVKLLDFGVSKFQVDRSFAAAGMTKTGVAIGTPHYMAPEQALGRKDVDHRVDVYAAGVLLYEMITGRLPFDAENTADLLVQIAYQRPPPVPLLTVSPDTPQTLAQAVQRAMSLDRVARYPTAASMREALQVALHAHEASATVIVSASVPSPPVPAQPAPAQPAPARPEPPPAAPAPRAAPAAPAPSGHVPIPAFPPLRPEREEMITTVFDPEATPTRDNRIPGDTTLTDAVEHRDDKPTTIHQAASDDRATTITQAAREDPTPTLPVLHQTEDSTPTSLDLPQRHGDVRDTATTERELPAMKLRDTAERASQELELLYPEVAVPLVRTSSPRVTPTPEEASGSASRPHPPAPGAPPPAPASNASERVPRSLALGTETPPFPLRAPVLDPPVPKAPAGPVEPAPPAPPAPAPKPPAIPDLDDDEPVVVPRTGFGSLVFAVIFFGLVGLAAVLFKLAG
ncbi:MAG: serine/threonine protein kinase [Deltaproteobacteria bacterium]|nr:serine/threonine protein kinase [Deltaproteobacteria bacterium]